MGIEVVIAVVVSLLVGGGVVFVLQKKRAEPEVVVAEPGPDPMLLLQQQMAQMQEQMTSFGSTVQQNLEGQKHAFAEQVQSLNGRVEKVMVQQSKTLEQNTQGMNQRMDKAAQVIGDVQRELSKVAERVQAVGELKDILRAPKLRGGFGEVFLGDLLGQILPREHFKMQHGFSNGKVVDAIVSLGERIVPIDSKFPLENFQKGSVTGEHSPDDVKAARRQFIVDVRRHIDAVSAYILPDESTYDFALMYIPAENIYYEVAVKSEWGSEERPLLAHALKKKVIPVSPNTLYAYLYTVSLGLRGMQVEKYAQDIIGRLGRVQKDFHKLQDEFGLVGKHLGNAKNAYEKVDKRLGSLDTKIASFNPTEAAVLPDATAADDTPAVLTH